LTAPRRLTVVVCRGPTCGERRGSGALATRLAETVAARGLQDRVAIVDEVCLGHCLRGPNILVQEEGEGEGEGEGTPAPFGGVLYNRMTLEDLDRVIERHLVGGMAVRVLMNRPPVKDPR
jgi:(2Fe-2S) ferredoxin